VRWVCLALLSVTLAGCSIKAGGWSICFLDNANLTLEVAHDLDPNAPH